MNNAIRFLGVTLLISVVASGIILAIIPPQYWISIVAIWAINTTAFIIKLRQLRAAATKRFPTPPPITGAIVSLNAYIVLHILVESNNTPQSHSSIMKRLQTTRKLKDTMGDQELQIAISTLITQKYIDYTGKTSDEKEEALYTINPNGRNRYIEDSQYYQI